MIFLEWLIGFIITLSVVIVLVKSKRIEEKWADFEVANSPAPILTWVIIPVFWIISVPIVILVVILSKFIKPNN